MVILQAGMAKSGNFWLYKIIQNTMKYAGLEKCSFIQKQPIHSIAKTWELSYKEQKDIDVLDINSDSYFYRISSIFRMPILDIDEYIRHCSHVWTHSAICDRSHTVLPKFDKVVCIIRDPRDVALSRAKFVFTPYMKKYFPRKEKTVDEFIDNNFNNIIRKWVRHVGGYLEQMDSLNIHIVFYEKFLHLFDDEMTRLLDYLEINLDDSAVQQIKKDVNFSTMKSENPMHVRKGRSGGWMLGLNKSQKTQADNILSPMLELLGYPSTENQIGNSLPNIPDHLKSINIKNAITYANRVPFTEKLKFVYKIIR